MSQRQAPITLDQVTEAAVGGVLRALDARKLVEGKPRFIPGPILCGIIWWPERLEGEMPFVSKDLGGVEKPG